MAKAEVSERRILFSIPVLCQRDLRAPHSKVSGSRPTRVQSPLVPCRSLGDVLVSGGILIASL